MEEKNHSDIGICLRYDGAREIMRNFLKKITKRGTNPDDTPNDADEYRRSISKK